MTLGEQSQATDDLPQPLILNPAIRCFEDGNGAYVLELDDRHGRTQRTLATPPVFRLLKRFATSCSWKLYREELAIAGLHAAHIVAIEQYLIRPCIQKRVLVRPGEPVFADDQPKKPPYVNIAVEIFPPRVVNWVCRGLQYIFAAPVVFGGLLAILAGWVSMFVAMHYTETWPSLAASQVIAVASIATIGVLLHEFGHAASGYRIGTRRVSIGVGWYFAIPVAYSDLSELWRYPRNARILVNCAGVYMQGLLLSALMLGYYFGHHDTVCLTAAGATAASMLWNLNPFLRLDGYWVAADAFGIHDLRKRSSLLLRLVVRNALHRRKLFPDDASLALVAYALIAALFLTVLLVRTGGFVVTALLTSVPSFVGKIWVAAWWSQSTISDLILTLSAITWQMLLLCAGAYAIASVPRRLFSWWRSLQ